MLFRLRNLLYFRLPLGLRSLSHLRKFNLRNLSSLKFCNFNLKDLQSLSNPCPLSHLSLLRNLNLKDLNSLSNLSPLSSFKLRSLPLIHLSRLSRPFPHCLLPPRYLPFRRFFYLLYLFCFRPRRLGTQGAERRQSFEAIRLSALPYWLHPDSIGGTT